MSPAEKVDAIITATSGFPALEGRVVECVVLPFVEQFSIDRHERYAFFFCLVVFWMTTAVILWLFVVRTS